MDEAFIAALRHALGEAHVVTDESERHSLATDWTGHRVGDPIAVVFPGSTDDVASVVKLANKFGVSIVPSGGRTGLAGGAVSMGGDIMLSLKRLRTLGEVDAIGGTVSVGAGVTTQAVHEHVAEADFAWPIDLAAKGTSTIGGNLACNAGGVRVVRYGLTREWVRGLAVVTAQGEVIRPGGALVKNNTGVDLRQLYIGSEGTLGIITEATLRLAPAPSLPVVSLVALPSLSDVVSLFGALRNGPFPLNAFETFTSACLARVKRHRNIEPSLEAAPHYALVEFEVGDRRDAFEAWLMETLEPTPMLDAVVSNTAQQAASLWEFREAISESLSATGVLHKNDIALPIAALDAFVVELERTVAAQYPDFEVCIFGHIGDGNLHVNVMKPDSMPEDAFRVEIKSCDAAMFELVQRYQGSVSAEHGIGLLKRDWLGHTRSAEELAIMRTLKSALDPKSILNPGKVLR